MVLEFNKFSDISNLRCGQMTYSATYNGLNPFPFQDVIKFDSNQRQFKIQTNDPGYNNTVLTIFVNAEVDLAIKTQQFQVILIYLCHVDQLIPFQVNGQNYSRRELIEYRIGSGNYEIEFEEFVKIENCIYPIIYTIEILGFNSNPYFIDRSGINQRKIVIKLDDKNEGFNSDYVLRVHGSVNNINDQIKNTLTIPLKLVAINNSPPKYTFQLQNIKMQPGEIKDLMFPGLMDMDGDESQYKTLILIQSSKNTHFKFRLKIYQAPNPIMVLKIRIKTRQEILIDLSAVVIPNKFDLFDQRILVLRIKEPQLVSAKEQHYLSISFKGNGLFRDQKWNQLIAYMFETNRFIPRQILNDVATKALQQAGNTVSTGVGSIVYGTFAINLLFRDYFSDIVLLNLEDFGKIFCPLQNSNSSDQFASVFAICLFGAMILFPITIWAITFAFRNRLDNQNIRARIGALYNEIRVTNNDKNITILYNVIYLLRRLSFSLVAVTLQDYPCQQIQSFQLTSILILIYDISVKPFETRKLNLIEIFNEMTILVVSYFMYLLTDYESNAERQYLIGWQLIAIVTLNMIGNIAMMMIQSIKSLKSNYKALKLKLMKLKQSVASQFKRIKVYKENQQCESSVFNNHHEFQQLEQHTSLTDLSMIQSQTLTKFEEISLETEEPFFARHQKQKFTQGLQSQNDEVIPKLQSYQSIIKQLQRERNFALTKNQAQIQDINDLSNLGLNPSFQSQQKNFFEMQFDPQLLRNITIKSKTKLTKQFPIQIPKNFQLDNQGIFKDELELERNQQQDYQSTPFQSSIDSDQAQDIIKNIIERKGLKLQSMFGNKRHINDIQQVMPPKQQQSVQPNLTTYNNSTNISPNIFNKIEKKKSDIWDQNTLNHDNQSGKRHQLKNNVVSDSVEEIIQDDIWEN
ncbi:UNKNOWN [Stylonychia lemnae]|uniref:TRP C-terminal domain-containing protein n=1 Tax=Stylonychia lemnae TaxID=5949 RepID=A0A078A2Y5_STYLE|nr:UNKNOWN [Stylonychia lemnae]|eukprot:CDW76643.1 UNKNOWN [Stylonychia lemnae]